MGVPDLVQCDGWWDEVGYGRQPMLQLGLRITGRQITGSGTDIVGPFTFDAGSLGRGLCDGGLLDAERSARVIAPLPGGLAGPSRPPARRAGCGPYGYSSSSSLLR